jgi:hypothetical protein
MRDRLQPAGISRLLRRTSQVSRAYQQAGDAYLPALSLPHHYYSSPLLFLIARDATPRCNTRRAKTVICESHAAQNWIWSISGSSLCLTGGLLLTNTRLHPRTAGLLFVTHSLCASSTLHVGSYTVHSCSDEVHVFDICIARLRFCKHSATASQQSVCRLSSAPTWYSLTSRLPTLPRRSLGFKTTRLKH